ncbi:DUF2218 domain-containing protein [Roseomonas sp. OT10]|uniref:DUF2218 domain-containing protein n=1 Tax=Roseomonas cutis TaxID=2897332 RepID=UPI001E5C4615|nr:DUF2218 domain-containing protein [Roseomonas sp. OT10]UFN50138.1 DUF2218 domain-containing protein [Roseomonas sp. OT10]
MPTTTARVPTASASRYLGQLVKHFGHKVPASQEGDRGRIEFGFGTVSLASGPEALTMTIESPDAENLARGEQVMGSHLVRFAFREELNVAWERPAG